METIASSAAAIASKATGLRPDQIARAVAEYRAAAVALENEPSWEAISHMSGRDFGIAQYGAVETKVTKQIESWRERGEWRQAGSYAYRGVAYELFAEARAAEMHDTTAPKPHGIQGALDTKSPAPLPKE